MAEPKRFIACLIKQPLIINWFEKFYKARASLMQQFDRPTAGAILSEGGTGGVQKPEQRKQRPVAFRNNMKIHKKSI
jgi:hypothetical protein